MRQEKERKGIQIGKEEAKLSLFTGDVTLCMKSPKDSVKKLLELIHSFGKVAGHKISM